MNVLDQFLGPMATVESHRAVRPQWFIWVRMLACLPAAGATIIVLWVWMLWGEIEPGFLPGTLLTVGLVAAEVCQVLLALLVSPALVSGAIAGEKDRGTLALLLASRLTTSDIILGRLIGCFSQVALILLAGMAPLMLIAALCHPELNQLLLLLALPAAVAVGSAGISVCASTLARRSRDALLSVYVIEVILLLVAYFSSGRGLLAWLTVLNPFAAIYPLSADGDIQGAAMTIGVWLLIGFAGAAIAVWQLRPAHLRQTGGQSRRGAMRGHRVPVLADQPMLWKELYLGRSGNFGAFLKWLIRLVTGFAAGSGLLLLVPLGYQAITGDTALAPLIQSLAEAIRDTVTPLLWLSQWLLGLRAVGAVATERQRSTWDAVLASSLEPKEILLAKAWGSLFGLRWLIASISLALIAAALAGELGASELAYDLALLIVGGIFMVVAGLAIGVGMSATGTTRGMAVTVALWMAGTIATTVLAFLIAAVSMAVVVALWATYLLATLDLNALQAGPTYGDWLFPALFGMTRIGLYLAATLVVGAWLAANFDRLSGRMGSWSISQRVMGYIDALVADPVEEAPPETSAMRVGLTGEQTVRR